MTRKISRREMLRASGAAIAASAMAQVVGTPGGETEAKRIRGKALLDRGDAENYSGSELKYIGMPVGGLFAGTVYLGGDGQLWNWDIFNQHRLGCVERTNATFMGESLHAGSGANYVAPVTQQSPFAQQFQVLVYADGGSKPPRAVRFGDIRFRGEYPVGRVTYRESDADIEMSLEAFSPFCPLDVESSSFPATTMSYRVKNVGKQPVHLRLEYSADNPVLNVSRKSRDDVLLRANMTPGNGIQFGAEPLPPPHAPRAEVLFEDWSSGTYGAWVVSGAAFGASPQKVSDLPSYMGPVNAGTRYVVNTHQTRNGEDVVKADQHTGTLRSPKFQIARKYISLRVGGGGHKGGTCVNLIVDGKVVRSVNGHDSNAMAWETMSVTELEGQDAYIEVVDSVVGAWGQVSLGEVVFTDVPRSRSKLHEEKDFGTFCIELIGGADEPKVEAHSAVVGRSFTLNPGQEQELTFVIAWHFPNCSANLPGKTHWYATRWPDAQAAATELIKRWPSLRAVTRSWNRTWYDSSLPYWFLDRTFVNTSILATTTCFRLDEGRFYFWEGVGCCAGTCTHVWGYAQAVGRVFPEVERYLRKEIDFGMAFHADTGAIDYRAEFHQTVATDGQASCILRSYREHLMSKDDQFLKSIWPRVKAATQYLIRQDANHDGILDGAQYNTLDTAWYGEIAWISSLYIAALRAASEMAQRMSDQAFSDECTALANKGSKRMLSLFNGEYFVNKVDPTHPEANNTNVGCHIDQVYGQSWAHQVGLPRVCPQPQTRTALKSLYKYSFYEDVWEYRRKNREIRSGRWYALPKEPGLIMCTFPKGGARESIGKSADEWAVMYFNECMSGFEYQAAAHMIAEGLVDQGLTVVRAIHERYHASKRNPYNEVECSDHYGRAMASYGCFIALTGFFCDGPAKVMRFNPKVASRRFRCAFINEKGWGTYDHMAEGATKIRYSFVDGKLSDGE